MDRFATRMKSKALVSVCVLGAALFNGCASYPGGPMSGGTGCGYGAIAGGLLGALAGAALGGKRHRGPGIAIGAAAGAALGCAAGYAFAKYLSPQENQQYNAALNRDMRNTSMRTSASHTWYSADGTKRIETPYGEAMPLRAALSRVGPNATLNPQVVSHFPQPPDFCRVAYSKISMQGGRTEQQPQVRCLDPNGDFVDVLDHTTA